MPSTAEMLARWNRAWGRYVSVRSHSHAGEPVGKQLPSDTGLRESAPAFPPSTAMLPIHAQICPWQLAMHAAAEHRSSTRAGGAAWQTRPARRSSISYLSAVRLQPGASVNSMERDIELPAGDDEAAEVFAAVAHRVHEKYCTVGRAAPGAPRRSRCSRFRRRPRKHRFSS